MRARDGKVNSGNIDGALKFETKAVHLRRECIEKIPRSLQHSEVKHRKRDRDWGQVAIEIEKNRDSVEVLSPREESTSGRRVWLTGSELLRCLTASLGTER